MLGLLKCVARDWKKLVDDRGESQHSGSRGCGAVREGEIKRRDGYVRKPGGYSASQHFTWQWHWGVWMCQKWGGVKGTRQGREVGVSGGGRLLPSWGW